MTSFEDKIYALLRTVPKGRVTTYKALAEGLGTKAYRAVGSAMRKNPFAPQVPCHRVVSSNGTIGGFMGKRSGDEIIKKKEMLLKEGVVVIGTKVKDFSKLLYTFKKASK